MITRGNSYQDRQQRAVSILLPELRRQSVINLLQLALSEDLTNDNDLADLGEKPADYDVTSRATISENTMLTGSIRAKASGVVAGLPVAAAVFCLIDATLSFTPLVQDGSKVEPGDLLAEVTGSGRSLLVGERTALNLLGRMSGIASLTRRFVDVIEGTQAVILDTRKTAPGMRYLDKYAVRMGGGQNHRIGLFDMVLIKDNHISAAGGITPAVEQIRAVYGNRFPIEVEVKNIVELEEALKLHVDRIMLDNMNLDAMRIAVQVDGGRIPLEASGNVTLANVRQIADTGVNFISSGSLTHSAPTLDISMKIR
jgi:nicotinate-nucleotide pyrophosphorylase (carboxylating)